MLTTCQALFAKELTEDESRFWSLFLKEYPISELRYAFDNWNRNGRYFPKPKDISELCDIYRAKEKAGMYPNCDAECKAQHWKGYGINDVKWLLRAYMHQPVAFAKTPWQLLDDLDKKREGGAPEWRKSSSRR